MMRFLPNANLPFVAWRRRAFILSAALIVAGFVSMIVDGIRYNIDFTGGTVIEVRFTAAVQIQNVRSALDGAGLGNADITYYGSDRDVLIRAPQVAEGTGISTTVEGALAAAFPDNRSEIRRTEEVGPKVGAELRTRAVYAVLIGWAAMLIYISIRFEFRFAVASVVGLVHNVLVTLGVFTILGYEMSLPVIAAFLTLIGYSINDTIVVFDRIREDLKLYRRETFDTIVNLSINQTLGRTAVTGVTVLFATLVLFLFGGSVLHEFAFVLVFGIVVGTYSSIFVAAPILIEWEHAKPKRTKR